MYSAKQKRMTGVENASQGNAVPGILPNAPNKLVLKETSAVTLKLQISFAADRSSIPVKSSLNT